MLHDAKQIENYKIVCASGDIREIGLIRNTVRR